MRQARARSGSARCASGSRLASSAITWRRRWICFCRAMCAIARLEYCRSFWRFMTSHIVVGSGPCGFHICTAKTSELRRGVSSNTASTGVLERMPPSQYSSSPMRTAGNAGGSAPDAITCLRSSVISGCRNSTCRLDRSSPRRPSADSRIVVDPREIDKLGQRLAQGAGVVVGGGLGTERRVQCP